MPEDKSLGSKLLGLFVERPEGEQPEQRADGEEQSAADIVAELARGAAGSAPAPAAGERPPPSAVKIPRPTGPVTPAEVDFDQVFKTAGVDPQDLDRVRKAEELLKTLPASTPEDVKRQIVEASLKAFGFDVTKIASAAQGQLKALDTWVRLNGQQTAKAISDAEQQISQLEDKVIGLRADIQKRAEQLASTTAAAESRKGQVTVVLSFFQSKPAAPAAPAAEPPKP